MSNQPDRVKMFEDYYRKLLNAPVCKTCQCPSYCYALVGCTNVRFHNTNHNPDVLAIIDLLDSHALLLAEQAKEIKELKERVEKLEGKCNCGGVCHKCVKVNLT